MTARDATGHEAQAGALVERLFRDLLGAATTYAVYLGDRLGLYRAMADGGPTTAAELASRAGIAERYARKWLEAQASDGILTLVDGTEAATRRFALPVAHAEVLADRDSLNYFAPFMSLLVAGGIQLPALQQAYRSGGGVSWGEYGEEMRTAQGDANRPMFLTQLGREYLPQVPEVHARLQQPGTRVADIGCGVGWSSIGIAEAYPNTHVDGYDLDAPSVTEVIQHAAARGLGDRVTFRAVDASTATGTYDLVIACECIHDIAHPVEVLATMRRLAGDTGTVIVMDEAVAETLEAPASEVDRLFYGYSLLVCLPDSLSHAGSVATGTVIRPSTLRAYAQSAGFRDIDVLPIENDFFRFYRLVR